MLAISRSVIARPRLLRRDEPSMAPDHWLPNNSMRVILKTHKEQHSPLLLAEENTQLTCRGQVGGLFWKTDDCHAGQAAPLKSNTAYLKKNYLGI